MLIFKMMVRSQLPQRIETERLILSRLRYEDAEEIFYTYASKPEATKYLAFPTHQSVLDARKFTRYAVGAWDADLEFVFSIRLKDSLRFIGTFGIINENGKVNFGYCISPSQWGNGYVTETCRTVLNILKRNKNIHRIWTFVDAENEASIKVLKKCGLKEEARLTNWFRFVNQDNKPKDCILFLFTE
jgi:RimJ/RimL family protein N-acetyltransferase